jgi:hypothetical protein
MGENSPNLVTLFSIYVCRYIDEFSTALVEQLEEAGQEGSFSAKG